MFIVNFCAKKCFICIVHKQVAQFILLLRSFRLAKWERERVERGKEGEG